MQAQIKSAIRKINEDPHLSPEKKEELTKTVVEYFPDVPDTGVYRILFTALGLIVITCIICATVIIVTMRDPALNIPDFIVGTIGTVVGALVGLFVPAPQSNK